MACEAVLLARQSAQERAATASRANQLLLATRAALLVDKAHLKNMGPHT